jgi:hypothetical protein
MEGDGEEVDAGTKAISRAVEAQTTVVARYSATVMPSSTQTDSTWSIEVYSVKVPASSAAAILMVFSES